MTKIITPKMKIVTAQLSLLPNSKWRITANKSTGGKRLVKDAAVGAYRVIENRLQKHLKPSAVAIQTAVMVEYGQGYYNDTNETNNLYETLYAMTCFMEGYLPTEFLAGRLCKYLKLMNEGE